MLKKLEEIFDAFKDGVKKVEEEAELFNFKSKYLGKKGELSSILSGLRDATADQRKEIGATANKFKVEMERLFQTTLKEIEVSKINARLEKERIDISLLDSLKQGDLGHGGVHPVTQIQQRIEDVFLSMGFDILDGPHIEDEFHNFEALNIPDTHPARDMQDTFWFHDPNSDVADKRLLRTHTSCIQVRGMVDRKPPFRFIAPGKVFRCERLDASHEMVFHQLEGMMVAEDISVANLIYFMKSLLSEIFEQDVEVRLRPGFFPFVEPGFELDIRCLICKGKGCSVCKQVGWLELLPCGMVHPNVLKAGGIDPTKFKGFAFGLGLDRLVMMKYGIDDIRHLHGGDLRFLKQFAQY